MMSPRYNLLLLLFSIIYLNSHASSFLSSTLVTVSYHRRGLSTVLFGNGKGKAKSYTWTENRREVEVSVKVPKDTKAKDIIFNTAPYSVDLKLTANKSDDKDDVVLLSGERQLRGKIRMDGTYWTIEDTDDVDDDLLEQPTPYREIKVFIEKHRFLADVECDDDWGGVFLDDKSEVITREYVEDEELDIDEYTKKLGVNFDQLTIDDIDQDMYSSADMTQGMFEKLLDSGFAREIINEKNRVEDYNARNQSEDKESTIEEAFIDPAIETDSQEAEATFDDEEQDPPIVEIELVKESTEGKLIDNSLDSLEAKFHEYLGGESLGEGQDPVDALTLAQLKEMCRDYNLKISGNKKELRKIMKEHIVHLIKADFDKFRNTEV